METEQGRAIEWFAHTPENVALKPLFYFCLFKLLSLLLFFRLICRHKCLTLPNFYTILFYKRLNELLLIYQGVIKHYTFTATEYRQPTSK